MSVARIGGIKRVNTVRAEWRLANSVTTGSTRFIHGVGQGPSAEKRRCISTQRWIVRRVSGKGCRSFVTRFKAYWDFKVARTPEPERQSRPGKTVVRVRPCNPSTTYDRANQPSPRRQLSRFTVLPLFQTPSAGALVYAVRPPNRSASLARTWL